MQNPTSTPHRPTLKQLRRELAHAERFSKLGKPGEAARRVQASLRRARGISSDAADTLRQLLRTRLDTYRQAMDAKNAVAQEREAHARERDLEATAARALRRDD